MSSLTDDSLDWLATRFVLGELSESEQLAFEERLADDLAACEAVTRAARLMLTARQAMAESQPTSLVAPVTVSVNTAEPGPARQPGPAKSLRHSWLVVVATSVAVAMLCVVGSQAPVQTSGVARLAGRDPAAAELVSLWHSGMMAAETDSDDVDELADAASDVAVPGWMLAAVSFEADGPDTVQEN